MPKFYILGLITTSVQSVAAGERQIQSQASQSRGDIGGFCLEGKDFVELLNAGLKAGLGFGGQRSKAASFADTLQRQLPSETQRPVAPAPKALSTSATLPSDLKTARTAKGVTQEQLGDAIGVGRKVIGKWENYGTTDENLKKALAALKRL